MPPGGFLSDYLIVWGLVVACVVATALFIRWARKAEGPARRWKILAGNALMLLTLSSFAFVMGETYLRYAFDTTTWHAGTLTTRAWFLRHDQRNSWDERDIEFRSDKAPGVERVLVLGDSFTFGYGVNDPRDRYTDRLRAGLETAAPGKFEIWNVGRIGATTLEEMGTLVNYVPLHRVDRVVLAFSPNDIEDRLPKEIRDAQLVEITLPTSWLGRLYLVDFIRGEMELRATGHAERYFDRIAAAYDDPELWNKQLGTMKQFADHCTYGRARLDVVIFPLFSHWGDDGSQYPYNAVHDKVADAWRALGVDVLDLRDAYRGRSASELVVNRWDSHPGPLAHGIAAEAIQSGLFGDASRR